MARQRGRRRRARSIRSGPDVATMDEKHHRLTDTPLLPPHPGPPRWIGDVVRHSRRRRQHGAREWRDVMLARVIAPVPLFASAKGWPVIRRRSSTRMQHSRSLNTAREELDELARPLERDGLKVETVAVIGDASQRDSAAGEGEGCRFDRDHDARPRRFAPRRRQRRGQNPARIGSAAAGSSSARDRAKRRRSPLASDSLRNF